MIMKNRLKMAMAAAEILYSLEREDTKEKRKEEQDWVRKGIKDSKAVAIKKQRNVASFT